MKLATLKNGTRDGQLVVVSRDLKRYTKANDVSRTLQHAIENWDDVAPDLQALAIMIEADKVESFDFNESDCESPLPRAYQWVDGSAYINHVELVRKARGAEVPASFYEDPLMYQGVSGPNLGPRDPILFEDFSFGYDMEAEVCVITDDVPYGTNATDAENHIKLLTLCNDISLRGLIPAELSKGFGFLQSKPPCAFSPVAVTPDELGDSWSNSLIHLNMNVDYNGEAFGRANSGQDATFNMAQLVAHAAKTRKLGAGTIVGSGTVSNKDKNGNPEKPVSQGGRGYSCIAEIRMIETILDGSPETPFMGAGDTVRIEMFGANNQSIFGAIEQTLVSV